MLSVKQVRGAIARGDFGAAQRASRNAREYNNLSLAIGSVWITFWTVAASLLQLTWIIPVAVRTIHT